LVVDDGAVGAEVRAGTRALAAFVGVVVTAETVGCAGLLASGLSGFVAAGCETVVLDAACCTGFVELFEVPAAFVVVAGIPVAALESHPGMLEGCAFCPSFFFLNKEPRVEMAFAALETVEAAWPPAFPAAAQGFEMALPTEPEAY
jgi:hypothetical protein